MQSDMHTEGQSGIECRNTSYTEGQSGIECRNTSYTEGQSGTECRNTSYTEGQSGTECRNTSYTEGQSDTECRNTSYIVDPMYQLFDYMSNRIYRMLTLCVGRMYPTHVGSMFPTYDYVHPYILEIASKVHLLSAIFLSATKLSFLFNSENVMKGK